MRDRILAFLVLLPSVLAVGVFVYGFIGQNLWVSLTDWGKDPAQALALRPELRFVGLENYRELFTGFVDVRFRQSVVNLIFFTLFFMAGSLGLGLLLALAVDKAPRGKASSARSSSSPWPSPSWSPGPSGAGFCSPKAG